MSRVGRVAVLIGLVLATTGCTGSRVIPGTYGSIYRPSEFSYAAGGRDLRTVVYGDPFGIGPQAFGKAVTDAMQGNYFGPVTNFTTTPNGTARQDYRVVVVFNPAEAMPGPVLCSRDTFATRNAPAGRSAGQPMEMQAAFCRGGKMASAVTGYLDDARSPADPGFRSLMADATHELFPMRDPNEDDDRCLPTVGGC